MNPCKIANLEILKARLPGYSGPSAPKQNITCELLEAKSGVTTLRYKGKLIHSAMDPVREGSQFAQRSGITEGDFIALYGLGLGYHVEGILEKIGGTGQLHVIELNEEILDAALSSRDLSGILSDHRVSLLFGTDKARILKDLDDMAKAMETKGGRFLIHPPSLKSIPEKFKEIENAFELLRMEKRTGTWFTSEEEENFEKNRKTALESKGVSGLFGKYTGKLGILVSAGPSLDFALPYLELLATKGIIFSTDTAFQILIDAGISPDFVVSNDPQGCSMAHFKGYFGHPSTLLFSPTSYPDIVKNFRHEKIVYTSTNQKKYFGKDAGIFESKGETSEGGSVACICLDFMARFGLNPIVLFGQDCCFPLKRSYAASTASCKEWLRTKGENMLNDFHQNTIHNQKVVWTTDRFGGKTPTHQNLYSYRGYIEQIAQANKEIRFYNFHSFGLPIKAVTDIFSINELCTLSS